MQWNRYDSGREATAFRDSAVADPREGIRDLRASYCARRSSMR
jgi:hypothetical protein